MAQQNRTRKMPRRGRSLICLRAFLRLCSDTAVKEHHSDGWIFWKTLGATTKDASDALSVARVELGKECPHFRRMLGATRSIFEHLHSDLQVLTESIALASDVELKKVIRFLTQSKKLAHRIIVDLPKVRGENGLDAFGVADIHEVSRLPRISLRQVRRLLREFQRPTSMGKSIAFTVRTRETRPVRNYNRSLTGSVGTPVTLPSRAAFFIFSTD